MTHILNGLAQELCLPRCRFPLSRAAIAAVDRHLPPSLPPPLLSSSSISFSSTSPQAAKGWSFRTPFLALVECKVS
jgi:hypothetical protein